MEQTSVSTLTESCLFKFDNLLSSHLQSTQRRASLKSGLSDFNRWVAEVDALEKHGTSLESRLQGREEDVTWVKMALHALATYLDDFTDPARVVDGMGHDEVVWYLGIAVGNFERLGVVPDQPAGASWNREADLTFDPDDYKELRKHLECVILGSTGTRNDQAVAKLDKRKLSNIQKRLIEANLRRWHQFLVAQKSSKAQLISPQTAAPPSPPSSLPEGPLADMQNAADDGDPTSYPVTEDQGAAASTAEGDSGEYNSQSQATRQTSFIALDVEFPKAPPIPSGRATMECPCCYQHLPVETLKDAEAWKQHIVNDLRPYTCVAKGCLDPQDLFRTRDEWKRHCEANHLLEWLCLYCKDQYAHYSSLEHFVYHLEAIHGDLVSNDSLASLIDGCTMKPMGITSCPLCSSCGPHDSPKLIDHIWQHIYDFTLRALPWPQPTVHEPNALPGSFGQPKDSSRCEDICRWINGAVHGSVKPASTDASFEYGGDCLLVDDYADDQSEPDQSSINSSAYSFPTPTIKDYLVNSVAFSIGGRQIAWTRPTEGTIKIRNIDTGRFVIMDMSWRGEIRSVAFSPNSQQLASASTDGYSDRGISIWSVETGNRVRKLMGHERVVISTAFSHDGQRLASASDDASVKIWDIESGHCMQTLRGHMDRVNSVTFSPTSLQVASASADLRIKIWDVATGRCTQTLQDGHTGEITAVAYSPNGRELASASWDSNIKLWDVQTGHCKWTTTLQGHDDRVSSVTFSPDGQQLASASWDCTIRVWGAATGASVIKLECYDAKAEAVTFSHDSRLLFSASSNGIIRLWHIATGACVGALPKDQNHSPEDMERYTLYGFSEYEIGWVCATRTEQLAARHMLDHTHGRLRITSWDENIYLMGNINKHNVVIACPLSMSRAGNDAKVLTDMMSVFPSIKVCLKVGTSTGASPRVGSGDVVVSRAENRDSALLVALAKLEAAPAAAELYTKMLYYINFAEIQIRRPGHLFKSPPHEDLGIFNGSLDESSKAAKRELKVHYGLVHENAYHTARANIPGVDGEAARLVTDFGCVIIRGIYDEARAPQEVEYAQITAAAYAKTLVTTLSVDDVGRMEAIKGKQAH